MPNTIDLGQRVKAKYPGAYDDLDDRVLGQMIKGKYPGSYDDFEDVPAPPLSVPLSDPFKQARQRETQRGMAALEHPTPEQPKPFQLNVENIERHKQGIEPTFNINPEQSLAGLNAEYEAERNKPKVQPVGPGLKDVEIGAKSGLQGMAAPYARVADTLYGAKGPGGKTLSEIVADSGPSPEEMEARQSTGSKIIQGMTRAPFDIARYGVTPGGPVTGMALQDAFTAATEAENPEEAIHRTIPAATKGATMGAALHGLSPYGRLTKIPAGAAIGGGLTALEGGNLSDVAASAVTMGALSGIHGKQQPEGYRSRKAPKAEISDARLEQVFPDAPISDARLKQLFPEMPTERARQIFGLKGPLPEGVTEQRWKSVFEPPAVAPMEAKVAEPKITEPVLSPIAPIENKPAREELPAVESPERPKVPERESEKLGEQQAKLIEHLGEIRGNQYEWNRTYNQIQAIQHEIHLAEMRESKAPESKPTVDKAPETQTEPVQKPAVSTSSGQPVQQPDVARSMAIEDKYGLSPAEAAVFNLALDRLPDAMKRADWSPAEALQKTALELGVKANVPLDKITNVKLARAIAEEYGKPVQEPFAVHEPRTEVKTEQPKDPWQMTQREYLASRPQVPEVAQPIPAKTVRITTQTLSGPKTIKAKDYYLPGYNGPQLAVAEYKTGRGKGYRVYLSESGVPLQDSNGVGTLNDTLKLAVQRVANSAKSSGVDPKLLSHYAVLKDALNAGKPVPPEVLADYPDLKPTAATPTIPETPDTLNTQFQQLLNGERKVVMFPKGSSLDALKDAPESIGLREDPAGNLYAFDPARIKAEEIDRAVAENRLPEVLGAAEGGMGAPDKTQLREPVAAVVGKTPEGVTTQATATDQANLPRAIEQTEKVTPPEGSVSVESPEKVVAERNPRRMSLADRLERKGRELIDEGNKPSPMFGGGIGALEPAANKFSGYVLVGAAKIMRGTVDFARWSAEMVREFGEAVKPHLQKVFAEAQRRSKALDEIDADDYFNFRRVAISDEAKAELRDRVIQTVMETGRFPKEVETWQEIRESLAGSKPEIARHLADFQQAQPEYRVVRLAAREGIATLNREIYEATQALAKEAGSLSEQELQTRQSEIDAKERDLRGMIDVWSRMRSEDGRNLAMHRMMVEDAMTAQGGFDLTYWVSRAKKAMGLPETATLPDKQHKTISSAVAEGEKAVSEAVQRARNGKPKEGAKLDREGMVERLKERLKAQIAGRIKTEETSTASFISPEERAAFDSDPEVLSLRSKLAQIKAEKQGAKNSTLGRDAAVEKAKQALIARLKAQAKGKTQGVSPVSIEERAAWENDPEILKLRSQIASRRLPKPDPTSDQKIDRGVKAKLNALNRKTVDLQKGEKQPPSVWKLTPEEKAIVDNDPRVIAARRRLALLMMDMHRTGLLDAISAFRKAGLLTGIKTHARNIGGNTAFQVMEELADLPSSVVDMALKLFTGTRTVHGTSPRAFAESTYYAATKGLREAKQIWKTGMTSDQLAKMVDIPTEVNTGNRVFDSYVNHVFRLMSAEDRVFKSFAMQRSLHEQAWLAEKNGEGNYRHLLEHPTEDMQIQAIADAEFATFNNKNMLASGFRSLQRGLQTKGVAGKAASFALDMAVPFANTPANIMARMFDYTPLGPAGRVPVAVARAIANKALGPAEQRMISQAIGRGMAGSALLFMGWKLAEAGLATGMRSKDQGERNVDEAAGRKPGAILVGNRWWQVSPFSPLGNLIVLGATMFHDRDKGAGKLIGAGASTVLEQPMLKGMNDFLDALKSPERSMEGTISSIAGSFVPTMVADVASVADTVRRSSLPEGLGQSFVRGPQSRIPGLRNTLPSMADVLGRPIEQSRLQTFDPTLSQSAKEKYDPVLRELVANDVKISRPERFKYQGGERENPEEYRLRSILTGRFIERELSKAIGSGRYQAAAPGEARREVLNDAIELGRRFARIATRSNPDYENAPSVDARLRAIQQKIDEVNQSIKARNGQ